MTLLNSRLPDFPVNPEDGFEIKEDLSSGYVMWTYSKQFNEWTYVLHEQPLAGYVFTDQVKTREVTDDIMTQQDVNNYLADTMTKRLASLDAAISVLQRALDGKA